MEGLVRTALEANDVDLMDQVATALTEQGRDEEAREWRNWAWRRRANADTPTLVVTPRDRLRFARHLVGQNSDPALAEAAERMALAIEQGQDVVAAFHALELATSEHLRTVTERSGRVLRPTNFRPQPPWRREPPDRLN
jgi:hypothetical protein